MVEKKLTVKLTEGEIDYLLSLIIVKGQTLPDHKLSIHSNLCQVLGKARRDKRLGNQVSEASPRESGGFFSAALAKSKNYQDRQFAVELKTTLVVAETLAKKVHGFSAVTYVTKDFLIFD